MSRSKMVTTKGDKLQPKPTPPTTGFFPGFEPMEPCRHCGTPFEARPGAWGRPIAFCSDACRHAHAEAQRKEWWTRNRSAAAKRARAGGGQSEGGGGSNLCSSWTKDRLLNNASFAAIFRRETFFGTAWRVSDDGSSAVRASSASCQGITRCE